MNEGQMQFLGFILERVKGGKQEEAKELLAEEFRKQSDGSFTKEDAEQFIPKILSLLKPEHTEEVSGVMKQFARNM